MLLLQLSIRDSCFIAATHYLKLLPCLRQLVAAPAKYMCPSTSLLANFPYNSKLFWKSCLSTSNPCAFPLPYHVISPTTINLKFFWDFCLSPSNPCILPHLKAWFVIEAPTTPPRLHVHEPMLEPIQTNSSMSLGHGFHMDINVCMIETLFGYARFHFMKGHSMFPSHSAQRDNIIPANTLVAGHYISIHIMMVKNTLHFPLQQFRMHFELCILYPYTKCILNCCKINTPNCTTVFTLLHFRT